MHKYDCGSILETDMNEIFSSQIIQTFLDPKRIREEIVGSVKPVPNSISAREAVN